MATMLEIAAKLRAAQLGSDDNVGSRPQRVLVYGDSGTGKTSLIAGLAAAGYRVHLFDLDIGSDVLFAALEPQHWENVVIYQVADLPENPRAAKLMDKVVRLQPSWFCAEHGQPGLCTECGDPKKNPDKYNVFDPRPLGLNDVLVCDTLTVLSRSAANFAAGREVMQGDLTYFKAEYEHHDKQGMLLSNFMQRSKQLPCHLLYITHVDKIENSSGKKDLAPIFGTRNFSRQLTKDFGHVVYTSVQNGKHKITSKSGAMGLRTKSRGNVDVTSVAEFVNLFKVTAVEGVAFDAQFDATEPDPEDGDVVGTPPSTPSAKVEQEKPAAPVSASAGSSSSLAALAALRAARK